MDNHSPRALHLSLEAWFTAATSDYQAGSSTVQITPSQKSKGRLPKLPFPAALHPRIGNIKGILAMGFFYPAFSVWHINQSILNACICLHMCVQSTYFSPFLTAVSTNWLYPSQILRFLLFLSRGPGKAAEGEGLLLFKHCLPPSWNAGLRRQQSPACSRGVIAFWKWAAVLRPSMPPKCSFQSPSAGRMEQGSSAPRTGWGH